MMVSALLFTISQWASLSYVHPFLAVYRIIGGLWQSARRQQYHRCICLKSHRKHARQAVSMQQFAIVFGQILIFYVNYKIASICGSTAH
ncbi:hypothetical protein KCP71_03335 [Salmonella enterica subsp. enterica]|nr:hypothetical protein KCP71_03335 [Salmonella enterica subsp. enterica]